MRCRNFYCGTDEVHAHGWACTAGCSACNGGQAENHEHTEMETTR